MRIMQAITLRLEEDTIQSLDSEAETRGVTRSEYIRELIERRSEYAEIDSLREELERVKHERNTLIQNRQETTDIVRYLEKNQEWETAPIWTRAKWWVFGKPQESG